MSPPRIERSREGGLKALCDLEKWKTSVFLCSITSLNCFKRRDIIQQLQKRFEFKMWKNLFWEMKRPSSTKEMTEIEIFRFFNLFSRIWKTDNKYKADKIGKKAESWLTPMFTSKNGEEKSFQKYLVFISTR